ncbi:hypothetical protein MMC18_009302 [Xylographa bjoerkii]|nr:hypothetical protein [Xylographa bjoerkii]
MRLRTRNAMLERFTLNTYGRLHLALPAFSSFSARLESAVRSGTFSRRHNPIKKGSFFSPILSNASSASCVVTTLPDPEFPAPMPGIWERERIPIDSCALENRKRHFEPPKRTREEAMCDGGMVTRTLLSNRTVHEPSQEPSSVAKRTEPLAKDTHEICTHLANALGSKLSFPGHAAYNATLESYWSLQEASLFPACIFVPKTSQDVAEAVSIISGIESCHFAIKGQSHAPAAGFANINAGVTIDVTSLKSVTVNNDNTVASVGAGASWLDVYLYLDALGLSVAGGRNGAVGVGGLTLGGGISYFAPRVGWACDNVVNFEIVLASGKLTNANATALPDLFRALKGGWNNYGIVTRFDLAAFPQGNILGGNIVQDISYRDEVFAAFADIAGDSEYDIHASLVMGLIFNATSQAWALSTTAIYTNPVLNPPVFDELLAIPTIANTQHITNLSTLAAEAPTPPLNWAFLTGTYGVSGPLLSAIFNSFNATMYDFNIPNGILWSVAFEPLPTVIVQHSDSKGGNSLGTTPKDGNAVSPQIPHTDKDIVLLLAGIWTDSISDSLVEKTAQKMMKDAADIARRMGLLHRFQYINYADPSQDPIGSYGPENVKRLRAASRKYDPKGVFQTRVPGGFKLGI